jgi:hypothetical protein
MDTESKFGLGLVAVLALCCAGPLVLSLLASGAILGAISAIWATDRPLLLLGGAMLIALGAGLWARRYARSRATPRRQDTPAVSRSTR